MTPPDVLVIGGGVVGAACARALVERGVRVELLDDGSRPGAATPASAGILAPFLHAAPEDPLVTLAVRGRDLYRDLVPALKDETGIDAHLWSGGIMQVAFTPEEVDKTKADVGWQRQQGLASDWLEPADVHQRAPGISPRALGALLSPEDGALDPAALLEALRASAKRQGVTISTGQRVESLKIEQGRVAGVVTDEGFRPAGAVLIAAGCWSGRMGGLPRPLSVEPMRGQLLALDWPSGEPTWIAFTSTGYVVRRGNEAIAGSTQEYVGFDVAVTDAGVAKILGIACQLYPPFEGKPIRRKWAGLRPGSPDGRPFIGRDPTVEGLWYATGHGRNGILLAPITGEIIGDLFTGPPVEHDLKAVDPGRYWPT
ncbi:MAG: glycine oxidase ThiO [Gemmatimonadetes bacterium]|nr:glycine oxidase ThiO [Gemmatimonadota bacterium]